MGLAVVFSRAQTGMDAPLVSVEVHTTNGLPAFYIVGLPETTVRESKDRVKSAITNSGFELPGGKIIVNLAPADLRKQGARFDLPIALGVLAAHDQVPSEGLEHFEFYGELSLEGALRRVRGVLPASLKARDAKRALFVPLENAAEACLASNAKVLGAGQLLDVCAHLSRKHPIEPCVRVERESVPNTCADIADVRGQAQAKRALEIAAAGEHNLLFVGPPGTGKSMLATRLPGVLPPMTEKEALESATVLSISAQGFDDSAWRRRPFRSPHHTASGVALVGGGPTPMPGEISLAHNGVLFLDELPEFSRHVLEVMREPMEAGNITISRAARQARFPARFQLIAAMNPCPCGHLGDPRQACRCGSHQVQQYVGRISGPLLDRIDMQVLVPPVPDCVLGGAPDRTVTSGQIAKRVRAARTVQMARAACTNARLTPSDVDRFCQPDRAGLQLIRRAIHTLGLSARAYHRILRLARTIADLGDMENINVNHLSEAIALRCLDRQKRDY